MKWDNSDQVVRKIYGIGELPSHAREASSLLTSTSEHSIYCLASSSTDVNELSTKIRPKFELSQRVR